MIRYIALDTETGGIGPQASLLTAFFMVLDENFNSLGSLDLAVKPNDGFYSVTAEALGINKINLVEHEKRALPVSQAGQELRDFLRDHSEEGKIKLIPLGHNVAFDLEKVYENLLNKKEAQKYVSYRLLDTGTVGRFLLTAGLIPDSVSGSLGSYASHFDVPKQVAHTADGDVRMTVDVLKGMLALVKR